MPSLASRIAARTLRSRLVELREAGKKPQEIAEELGISAKKVYDNTSSWKKSNAPDKPPSKTETNKAHRRAQGRPEKVSDLQWEAYKLRRDNPEMSSKAIAEKLNTSPESISASLSRAREHLDIAHAKKGRPKSERPRIEELIDADYSDKTIAQRLGKSQGNIGQQRKNINDSRPPEKRKYSRHAKYGTALAAAGIGAGAAGGRGDD